MRRSTITVGVAIALLALVSAAKTMVWQSGQIVSMKEEGQDQDGNWTSYVYGLHAKDHTYAVVISTPLKAYLHSTVKFAVEKNLFYIQDLDGKVRKGCILESPDNSHPH